MPDATYRALKKVSEDTNTPLIQILIRGIDLGMLEAITKNNGGCLLLQEEGKDPIIIK